jgi:hypothetical protein
MLLEKREGKRKTDTLFKDNTTQVETHTDNRHIIPMRSQGFYQAPQDIMEMFRIYTILN